MGRNSRRQTKVSYGNRGIPVAPVGIIVFDHLSGEDLLKLAIIDHVLKFRVFRVRKEFILADVRTESGHLELETTIRVLVVMIQDLNVFPALRFLLNEFLEPGVHCVRSALRGCFRGELTVRHGGREHGHGARIGNGCHKRAGDQILY